MLNGVFLVEAVSVAGQRPTTPGPVSVAGAGPATVSMVKPGGKFKDLVKSTGSFCCLFV